MKKFSSLARFFKCVTRNLTHIVTYVCFLGIIKSGSCQYWKDSSSNYGNFDENIVSIISNFPMNWYVGLSGYDYTLHINIFLIPFSFKVFEYPTKATRDSR